MVATYLRPDADSSDGSWLNASSSNTDLYASVDESTYDDADYIRSSITDGDTVRLRLSDPLTGVDGPLIVRYRCKSEGFPAQMAGYLTQSTSTSTGLIAYWELEPTDTFATYATTLTTAQFDQITDFNDLYVTFSSVAQAPHLTGNIDLNFQAGTYYELGTVGTKSSTDYLSCSRASIGYAKNADGTLTSFGNDTLRITTNGLLVEDARTNIILYSNDASNAQWAVLFATKTANASTAPDGTSTAALVTEDTSVASFHRIVDSSPASTANATYTYSLFVKDGTTNGRRYIAITAWNAGAIDSYTVVLDTVTGTITDTHSTGSPISPSYLPVEVYGDGWYRISIIITNSTNTNDVYVGAAGSNSATPSYGGTSHPAYDGDGVSNFYVWGGQIEIGGFSSSFIPTTTAAATRAADVVTCIGSLNTILNTTSLSFLMDFIITDNAGTMRIFDSGSGTVNCQFTSATDGNFTDGTTANIFLMSGSIFNGVKYAFAIDASSSYVSGNGTAVHSQASTTVPIPNLLLLGSSYSPFQVFGYLRRFSAWNSKLADATLQALTAP